MLAVNLRRQLTPSLLGALRTAAASFSASAEPADALDGASLVSIDGHGCVVLDPHINGDAPASSSKASPVVQTRNQMPPSNQRQWQRQLLSPHQQPFAVLAGTHGRHGTDGVRVVEALAAAPTIAKIEQVLRAHWSKLGSRHALVALSRMGELQRLATFNTTTEAPDQEAFANTRELAFQLLTAEKRQLSIWDCCQLVRASACMALPLATQQQEVIETTLTHRLTHISFDIRDVMDQLLCGYLELGMQPGSKLAAIVAPRICMVYNDQGPPVGGEASPPPPQDRQQQQQQHDWVAEQHQKERQHSLPSFRQLGPGLLTAELVRANSIHRVLSLLVLHQDRVDPIPLLTSLRKFIELGGQAPASAPSLASSHQSVFRALWLRAVATVKADQAEPATQLGHVCQLLQLWERMDKSSRSKPQETLKTALRRCSTALEQMYPTMKGYVMQGLEPGSPLATKLQSSIERLLPHLQSLSALCVAPAGEATCDWQVSPTSAAAVQAAVIDILRADPTPDAVDLVRLLAGLEACAIPVTPELTAALRQAVLRCLPSSSAPVVAGFISRCNVLRLLPDGNLQHALLSAVGRILPESDVHTAVTLLSRLIHAFQQEGSQQEAAPGAMQAGMRSLMCQLQPRLVSFVTQEPATLTQQELQSVAGSLARYFHVLAAARLRPGDSELKALASYLKRHWQLISPAQQYWVRNAYAVWQQEEPDWGS